MEVYWPTKIHLPYADKFREFVNCQTKRLAQGRARYGLPDRRYRYMTRLDTELKAYRRTGNMEHLINIANYAVLESIEPENRRFHFDNGVGSVTRGRVRE